MRRISIITAGVALASGLVVGVAGPASAEDNCPGTATVHGQADKPEATAQGELARAINDILAVNASVDNASAAATGVGCVDVDKAKLVSGEDIWHVEADKVEGMVAPHQPANIG